MTSTTVVLGDVHARIDKVVPLLERMGLLRDGERQPGFHVVQAGDLVNLAYGVEERAFLELARTWVDEHVLGNHELPAGYWAPERVLFAHWDERDRDAEALVRATWDEWQPARSVGPWLITHAGLSLHHWTREFDREPDAARLAAAINDRFRAANEQHERLEVFEGIGAARRRVDPSPHPGLFWIDIEELTVDYRDPEFTLPQIVGHTPDGGPSQHGPRLWCIDTPQVLDDWGGVAALVTRDDGATFELFHEP